MRKWLLAGLVVAGVAAAYVGVCFWTAYGLPADEAGWNGKLSPQCAKIPWHWDWPKGSATQCENRIMEAEMARQNSGLFKRDGEDLTIYYRGKGIAHLAPFTTETRSCDTYDIHRILRVYDPSAQDLQPLAEVTCSVRAHERRLIITPDGDQWEVPEASVSPDGRLIAVGSNGGNGSNHGLILYSWPLRKVVAHFKPDCRVLSWRNSHHARVTCADRVFFGYRVFDAKIWYGWDRAWHMQATRWLGGDMPDHYIVFTHDGNPRYPPAFSLLPLPHSTAMQPSSGG